MESEILSIETVQKLARLEKVEIENKQYEKIICDFDREVNLLFNIIKDAYEYLDKKTLCFKDDKDILKRILSKGLSNEVDNAKVYQDNFNNSLSNNSDNEFTKKLRALKKYCPQAYKFVIFKFKDTYLNVENGEYSINLPTSKEFKFVYGQIKLIYRVKNKGIKFIDLEPSDFFIDGYRFDLEVYKSIYYRNAKDKFKIDLMLEMKKGGKINE